MTRLLLALLVAASLAVVGCTRGRCRAVASAAPAPKPVRLAVRPGVRHQYLVEMHCARVDVGKLPNVLGMPPGDGRTLVAVETKHGAAALLDHWREHPAVALEAAPSVITVPGDVATISVGEMVPGVAHLMWPPSEDEFERFLGTHIVLLVEPDPTGLLRVHFHGLWRRLDPSLEPLRENVDAFAQAVADLPVAEAKTTIQMPDDGYVVVAAPRVRQSDGTFRMFTLLHAVRLEPGAADDVLIEMGPRVDGPGRLPK